MFRCSIRGDLFPRCSSGDAGHTAGQVAIAPGTHRTHVAPVLEPDGKGILIVDDEPLMRRSVWRILRSLDPQLRDAADGSTALALIEQAPPAVLLTDYKMPGMNGRELAEAVNARYPQILIVIHSGNAEYTLAGNWWPDFDVTLIPKPAHPELMRSIVAAALANRGPRR